MHEPGDDAGPAGCLLMDTDVTTYSASDGTELGSIDLGSLTK